MEHLFGVDSLWHKNLTKWVRFLKEIIVVLFVYLLFCHEEVRQKRGDMRCQLRRRRKDDNSENDS